MSGIGIVGVGHAVPELIRRNDDPLFSGDQVALARELFVGFRERRVLAPGERVEDLGTRAARAALADAALEAGQIDRLYGAVSPSEHSLPSGLFAIHEALGLARETRVIPIQSEFTNFVDALGAAVDAVRAGRSERALVVVATGWSRVVDYADAGAAGIGDGAGAVVVSRAPRLEFIDDVGETHAMWRQAMTVQMRVARRSTPGAPEGSRPTFVFGEEGADAFRELATSVPERLVRRLCERNKLAPADLALIGHQPSGALLQAWRRTLAVAEVPSVLEDLGNSTIATAVITLALHERSLTSRHIVLLGLGLGQNFSAALLRRTDA